jgi:hypothetical protein
LKKRTGEKKEYRERCPRVKDEKISTKNEKNESSGIGYHQRASCLLLPPLLHHHLLLLPLPRFKPLSSTPKEESKKEKTKKDRIDRGTPPPPKNSIQKNNLDSPGKDVPFLLASQ